MHLWSYKHGGFQIQFIHANPLLPPCTEVIGICRSSAIMQIFHDQVHQWVWLKVGVVFETNPPILDLSCATVSQSHHPCTWEWHSWCGELSWEESQTHLVDAMQIWWSFSSDSHACIQRGTRCFHSIEYSIHVHTYTWTGLGLCRNNISVHVSLATNSPWSPKRHTGFNVYCNEVGIKLKQMVYRNSQIQDLVFMNFSGSPLLR